jgi:hypothetical protein
MVIESLYQTLSPLLDTYYIEIPSSNTTFPVCFYYVVSDMPRDYRDDQDQDEQIMISIDVFQTTYDDSLIESIKEAITFLDGFPSLQNKFQTKEDGKFRTHFEYEFIQFQS